MSMKVNCLVDHGNNPCNCFPSPSWSSHDCLGDHFKEQIKSLESQLKAADELAKMVKDYREEYAHVTRSVEDRLLVSTALSNALTAYEKARER